MNGIGEGPPGDAVLWHLPVRSPERYPVARQNVSRHLPRLSGRIASAGDRRSPCADAELDDDGGAQAPKNVTARRDNAVRAVLLSSGGGGGSRTPVRESSTRSVYRFRSGTYLALPVAPDRARQNQTAGNLLATIPGSHRTSPA